MLRKDRGPRYLQVFSVLQRRACHFGCCKGAPNSLQVLFNGIEAIKALLTSLVLE